jgi:mannosylglucosylglycerate synthase
MSKRVAILHYASPPTIGGVEMTIAHHARGLVELGYRVRVVSGAGADFDERIETFVHPLFGSREPQVLAVKRELDTGFVSENFHNLLQQQLEILRQALEDCDVSIVHNIHTLNKNLALTAALHQLQPPNPIAWCHDIAWTNEQYLPELYEDYPWNLLRQKWQDTRYVTVSRPRQGELAGLFELPEADIAVVTAGMDLPGFLQWTSTTRMIVEKLKLLDADVLLLLPARLTRRKNIEFALEILHRLKQQNGKDYRLIVTGPPGPHNPGNSAYLDELLELRNSLGLQNSAHFLYELGEPQLVLDDTTIANLYQIADALLFPSLQEGFGIPILEAGLLGLPIFCSNLPPLQETGQADLNYFDPLHDSSESIAIMIHNYFTENARQRLKTRVRQDFRWETIVKTQIVPLMEDT